MKKGEKLKEELLISGKIVKTIHPLINKAEEEITIDNQFQMKIDQIIELAKSNNKHLTLKLFNELIDKYS